MIFLDALEKNTRYLNLNLLGVSSSHYPTK